MQPLDAQCSELEAGAHSPELLAVYLGALGLGFHVDADHTPELAQAVRALTERYAASVLAAQPAHLPRHEDTSSGAVL